MYSISWAYGQDYREVAQWNNIPPPYIIKRGQRLRVTTPQTSAPVTDKSSKNNQLVKSSDSRQTDKVPRVSADKPTVVVSTPQQSSESNQNRAGLIWQWPTRGGRIIQDFDANDPGKQGVDVAGQLGQPIYSAESGQVVYSGGGLHRYGKLIIVKHNETFLSAYAHNKRLLVREGDVIKSGQLIAEMGSTGTNTAKLHFEIRRNGKPVNPLQYLPKQMK